NSEDFTIVARVFSDEELHQAIVSGNAHVGVKIPSDYSQRLQAGQTAQILILVDGSESTVAAEAVNVGNAIALRESLEHAVGDKPLRVDSRPRVLFNPDTRSANFFVPGLMVVLCQMMATTLAATAIVREKESGTLEQLFLTPVRSWELVIGKMAPYLVLTTLDFSTIALVVFVVSVFLLCRLPRSASRFLRSFFFSSCRRWAALFCSQTDPPPAPPPCRWRLARFCRRCSCRVLSSPPIRCRRSSST